MTTTRETLERLVLAWDGNIDDLIDLLRLLNRIRDRGIRFAEAKTYEQTTALQDEVAQLRTALRYIANNDRWDGVPRLREFALQALGESDDER